VLQVDVWGRKHESLYCQNVIDFSQNVLELPARTKRQQVRVCKLYCVGACSSCCEVTLMMSYHDLMYISDGYFYGRVGNEPNRVEPAWTRFDSIRIGSARNLVRVWHELFFSTRVRLV